MQHITNNLQPTRRRLVFNGTKVSFLYLLFITPFISHAQSRVCDSIDNATELGLCTIVFLNYTLVPFLFSLALLFFIYFVIKYFIVDINNADGKEKAKRYAFFSIAGFVLMVSLWGIVNLLVGGSFGTNISDPVCPDIVPYCNKFSRNGGFLSGGDGTGSFAPSGSGGGSTNNDVLVNDPVPAGTNVAPDAQEINFGKARQKVISEMQANGIDGVMLDSRLTILAADSKFPDEKKIETVKDLYKFNYISRTTTQNYIDTLNAVRASGGKPYIFTTLPNPEPR